MDRLLRSAGGTIEIFLEDSSGNLADAGNGDASVVVVDSGGNAIAGSPLTGSHVSAGVYQAIVPTSLAVLDTYTATWTFPDTSTRTTEFEVVGGLYFTIRELRAFEGQLADATAFPGPVLVSARQSVEERFESERNANLAFVPRGRRWTRDGTGTPSIMLPDVACRKVVSAWINGDAMASPDLAALQVYPHGQVIRGNFAAWAWGIRNVTVLYEHGLDQPPGPVKDAALVYARWLLLNWASKAADRSTAIQTDSGYFRLTLAGRDGPTGLPEVDAVIAAYGRQQGGSFA